MKDPQNSTTIILLMLAARIERLSELSPEQSKSFASLAPISSEMAHLSLHIANITTPIIKIKEILNNALAQLDGEVLKAQSPQKMQLAALSAEFRTLINGLEPRLIPYSNKAENLLADDENLVKEFKLISEEMGTSKLFDSVQAQAAFKDKLANLRQQSVSFRDMSQPVLNDAGQLHKKIFDAIPSAAVRENLVLPIPDTTPGKFNA